MCIRKHFQGPPDNKIVDFFKGIDKVLGYKIRLQIVD